MSNKSTAESQPQNSTESQPVKDPTPFIAVAANYYGTGPSIQKARIALVKAGGSKDEPQKVYQLPDGASGAYVAMNGQMYWFGAKGAAVLVARYVDNKPVELTDKERAEKAQLEAEKPGKPKQEPTAQEDGAEPDDQTKADIVAAEASKPAQELEVVEDKKAKPAKKPKVTKKPKAEPAVEEVRQEGSQGVVGAADEDGVAYGPADFLLFIGSNFYKKADFIAEAAQLGISRRMPSHRLPHGFQCGKSRVFVAAEGARSSDAGPVSEVFGYFVPQRIEFIQGSDNKQFAEIVATLKLRDDTRIVGSVENEPPRQCGTRKEGGTYIVVDNADSPLHVFERPSQFAGNHFRGMMRLSVDQSEALADGGTVDVLVSETCMRCNSPMKCSPDGHQRAVRERKRIAKGEEPKWLLLDKKCAAELRKQQADEGDGASAVETANGVQGTE